MHRYHKKTRQQYGFTLIELIIVIVILGILAVTAAPKFVGLSKDARVASLEQMATSLKSGSQLVYAKALINNQTVGQHDIDIGGVVVVAHSGYPRGVISGYGAIVNLEGITFLMTGEACTEDWCSLGNRTTVPSGDVSTVNGKIGKLIPKGFEYSDECGVYFLNEEDGSQPTIGIETDDC